jgi:hypothetical protein
MLAGREMSMVVLAAAFCLAGIAAAQVQERATSKQAPKAAIKGVPPEAGAWKWSPTDKTGSKGQPPGEAALKISPGEKNAKKGGKLPSEAAMKYKPGTTQSLNPQPLPPREAGTMAR